jgi:hypothetical protein
MIKTKERICTLISFPFYKKIHKVSKVSERGRPSCSSSPLIPWPHSLRWRDSHGLCRRPGGWRCSLCPGGGTASAAPLPGSPAQLVASLAHQLLRMRKSDIRTAGAAPLPGSPARLGASLAHQLLRMRKSEYKYSRRSSSTWLLSPASRFSSSPAPAHAQVRIDVQLAQFLYMAPQPG